MDSGFTGIMLLLTSYGNYTYVLETENLGLKRKINSKKIPIAVVSGKVLALGE